jgi:Transposase DNA-binding
MARWIGGELGGCDFGDERLKKRFLTLVGRLSEGVGETIPAACQDWANTKAAYRFFSNDRVDEQKVLSGHFQSTRDRFRATEHTVLVLHDTTEFSFKRNQPGDIGFTTKVNAGKDKAGRPRTATVCGILMHSSLAVTPEGVPLGLSAVKFWTRKEFKGTNALKKKINPTRVPIEEKESVRWMEVDPNHWTARQPI